jgi:aspartyl-tRNA(Asn)/glutamyl-tRNA(Gln) amidotransferase subunit C
MQIEDIEKLAELAKIELTDCEKQDLLRELDSILGYVKQVESVDVSDVELEYKNRNVWREDKIKNREFSREEIIEQFPDAQDGFVKVKKIL